MQIGVYPLIITKLTGMPVKEKIFTPPVLSLLAPLQACYYIFRDSNLKLGLTLSSLNQTYHRKNAVLTAEDTGIFMEPVLMHPSIRCSKYRVSLTDLLSIKESKRVIKLRANYLMSYVKQVTEQPKFSPQIQLDCQKFLKFTYTRNNADSIKLKFTYFIQVY